MFTQKEIENAHSRVKSGSDFPKLVSEFKSMGINKHKVLLDDASWTFYGEGGYELKFSRSIEKYVINTHSNQERFAQILKNHQAGNTDYLKFCSQSAECGVLGWVSDFELMNVTYFDLNQKTLLIEDIPIN